MNFLLRTTHPVAPELPPVQGSCKDLETLPDQKTTLEGLISGDPYTKSSSSEDGERENEDGGTTTRVDADPNGKSQITLGKHSDVTEEEGWITIPYKELEDWNSASDIQSFRDLDRSFLFPGEQIHILACLSACKQDTEIITPFKVAAVISKSDTVSQITKQKKESVANATSADEDTHANSEHHSVASEDTENNAETGSTFGNINEHDISATESLIRMEDQRQKTENLLERFRNSHFFIRISESDEPLWAKRTGSTQSDDGSSKTSNGDNTLNALIDRGRFDGNSSGGMARNSARCWSLPSGDIVVLLQVNVGTNTMKDPVIEVLQFEKHPSNNLSSVRIQSAINQEDPCKELLTWLLPLDRALPPRPLSPVLSSSSGAAGASHRPTLSASSGSQLFSFSHFRSYSMPSIPQTSIPPSLSVPPSSTKSNFEVEDFHDLTTEKTRKSQDVGTEGLLSFRGVPLEPERYSVQCGLGGIYFPGRRWRRKIEIIQPIEIHSFAADCNTEDFLCVQIKNVSPTHTPDIVIFLDSISIVFEEAPKDGPPLSLPISCIEAGNGYSLPNLALRRGEEHSFILKPAASTATDLKSRGYKSSHLSQTQVGISGLSALTMPKVSDGSSSSSGNQYAILVSCRSNYTESKLFFKRPTRWQPRIPRDLIISVASEISGQTIGPEGKISQLPVQILTLQASNLTTDDATLTVLAPASFTAPPSVVLLNSAPTTPVSPFAGFPEFMGRAAEDKRGNSMQRLSSMPVQESQKENDNGGARSVSLNDRTASVSDMIPNSDLGCTHLWLQSTVPLGCVPAQSSATVKLELLPLTDGIITLDTLQIAVKEKGLTYIPERSLKIHATSSVATGIM